MSGVVRTSFPSIPDLSVGIDVGFGSIPAVKTSTKTVRCGKHSIPTSASISSASFTFPPGLSILPARIARVAELADAADSSGSPTGKRVGEQESNSGNP